MDGWDENPIHWQPMFAAAAGAISAASMFFYFLFFFEFQLDLFWSKLVARVLGYKLGFWAHFWVKTCRENET